MVRQGYQTACLGDDVRPHGPALAGIALPAPLKPTVKRRKGLPAAANIRIGPICSGLRFSATELEIINIPTQRIVSTSLSSLCYGSFVTSDASVSLCDWSLSFMCRFL